MLPLQNALVGYRTMIQLSIYCNDVYSPEAGLLVAQKDIAIYIQVTNSHVTQEGIHVGENKYCFLFIALFIQLKVISYKIIF